MPQERLLSTTRKPPGLRSIGSVGAASRVRRYLPTPASRAVAVLVLSVSVEFERGLLHADRGPTRLRAEEERGVGIAAPPETILCVDCACEAE